MTNQANDLIFLHGRTDPAQDMDDWGFDGPVLEGVAWVHWTYGNMNVAFVSPEAAQQAADATGWKWMDENILEMTFDDDLVVIRPNSGRDPAQYFGDFEIQGPGYRRTKGEE